MDNPEDVYARPDTDEDYIPPEIAAAQAVESKKPLAPEMPQSLEAEQCVVGAMLMDPQAVPVATEIINESDFYYQLYGNIFITIVDLYNHNKSVDPVTVINQLREKGV